MRRGLISRLLSPALMVLILSGGGGLPVLDGLIFHSRDRAPEAQLPHYEATSGHHADGCAVHSTAHQARLAGTLGPDFKVFTLPALESTPRPTPLRCARIPTGQLHSRGPPLFG